jgi:hypothetical protein
MKGCDERKMMIMFIRMGSGVLGHHERLKEVGQEGGWSIMKKQTSQEAI